MEDLYDDLVHDFASAKCTTEDVTVLLHQCFDLIWEVFTIMRCFYPCK